MALAGRSPIVRRVWFSDQRTPNRRLSVSTHPSEGIAVVSLWQGQTCTGTFRLPLAEAARMITALADGMAAGLVEPPDMDTETLSGPWTALRRWVQHQLAGRSSSPQTGLRILK